MKFIEIDWGGAIATYPLHQMLYLKWLPESRQGVLRFQGDYQNYYIRSFELYEKFKEFIHSDKSKVFYL